MTTRHRFHYVQAELNGRPVTDRGDGLYHRDARHGVCDGHRETRALLAACGACARREYPGWDTGSTSSRSGRRRGGCAGSWSSAGGRARSGGGQRRP